MHLSRRVGTPSAPANPQSVPAAVAEVLTLASSQSGCGTPIVAENELFGAGTAAPWSATNAQYRANVLAFLRGLSDRGAHPVLLVSSPPYTGGDAGAWWQQVAQVATIVQEFFVDSKATAAKGPLLASRKLRTSMRAALAPYASLGIPPARLGLMLELEGGAYGRQGLKPASAWFELVKLETLAAQQVATELFVPTLWTWGWGTFTASDADPDKPAAACVALWARSADLCDGPAAAGSGFDATRSEGQLVLPAGVRCALPGATIAASDVDALAVVTGDKDSALGALLERAILARAARVSPGEAAAAEQALVTLAFGGDRGAYLRAVDDAHATPELVRALLADGLRRSRVEATLPVAAPSDAAVRDFYATYRSTLVRRVSADRTLPWPGGASGLVIGSLAPARLFDLPDGGSTVLRTLQGTFAVRVHGRPVALGSLPLARARPVIVAALAHFARASAYAGWLTRQETAALAGAVCLGDHLPPVGPVDAGRFLPFLASA
jgi:hypothetical protein